MTDELLEDYDRDPYYDDDDRLTCESCGRAAVDLRLCPSCGWVNCWRCRETMDDCFLDRCKAGC